MLLLCRIAAALTLLLPGAAAQVFQPLGTAGDPCVGGNVWPSPQLRFGDFSCTFNLEPGMYQITLGLAEPYITTAANSRVFNVLVNGGSVPEFQGIDIVAIGGGQTSKTLRSAIIYSTGVIKIQTVTTQRSAVLSSIGIRSVNVITGLPCTYPAQLPAGVPTGTNVLMAQLGDGTCLPLLLIPPPAPAGIVLQDGSIVTVSPASIFPPQRQ